jgi:putative heme-binding domain-containing protein
MHRSHSQLACLALAILAAASPFAFAAQPPGWADKRLPEKEGLALWLDAAAQNRALAPFGMALLNGSAFNRWLDSSGHDRHMSQPAADAQPKLRLSDDFAAVRFDGVADHFALDELKQSFDELTVFIVAAPFNNAGNFRGLLSMHAAGQDDFRSGLNIDLGPWGTPTLDIINVEGAGMPGFHNFRTKRSDFMKFHRLCLTSKAGASGATLHVDGELEGARDRVAAPARMDSLLIAARGYGGSQPRGLFAGEIAEIIVYDHALSDEERTAVDGYLAAKYENPGEIPPPSEGPGAPPIPRVNAPPPVQMLVPGFTVRELPVKLLNINNVLYREDGKLVALGYDGNVYLLTDSDGDGLEDHYEYFWENAGQIRSPIGMALTPPGYKRGRGVLVAAKSKCVLLLDADGDDRAEEEVIVADGWQELFHGVDALGVAFDPRDESIYFGLGTTNFTDAYIVGNGTEAKYQLDSERGTILRVAPDFKSREIVATGIRFPVGIRFNAAGDLFCSDQEGATWLANGNPFDELLHIERGRHYGFPPRHPRHLPEVIDEPSVYDYTPQHQSTCGLNFNEPATDGTVFGPDWWRSDALVAGYSRGKLYRTKLTKTAAGYVAQNQLIASIASLPADVCVAPNNSVVIASHSGGPDWGSGPSGDGKLFKATYADAAAPIPALVWPAGPREVRIAFDRPIDPKSLKELAAHAKIEAGEFAAAADRLEVLRPGYAAVEYQQMAPRSAVDVHGVQLTPDRRTLILTTAPQSAAINYAILLPGVRTASQSEQPEKVSGVTPQLPDIDLQYNLHGVEAAWEPAAGAAWKGWLPHLDLEVSRAFTPASALHDQFWLQLEGAGTLTLRTSLVLNDMLRPAVQIGSTIDYHWPQEEVTLTIASNGPFEVDFGGQTAKAPEGENGTWTVERMVTSPTKENHPLEVRLQREPNAPKPTLTITFHTNEDKRSRALPLRRFVLPWARPTDDAPVIVNNRDLSELAGGNWLRGHKEFFGPDAGCSKCHTVRGQGAKIGPDLSNLTKRDYASVVRDVTQPSYAINPDHVTQLVVTADGRVLTGTVRTEGDELIVADQEGRETRVDRAEVDEVQASNLSIMPEGIPKTLGPDRFRDLLTFLLVEPPSMPVYGDLKPPPARTRAEVEAVLAESEPPSPRPRPEPVHIVLVAGPKDHGLGEHDYPAWQTAWQRLFEMDEQVKVTTANPWPIEEDLKTADALVFYQQGAWTPERERDLDRFLRRGGGAAYIHYAVDGGADPPGFAERIGLAWQGGRSKFRHGPLDIAFAPGKDHPIARNFDKIHFHDESYWNLVGDPGRINLLATGKEEDADQPLFWTYEPEAGGRVFVSIPGHFAWTFDDPLFRILMMRGIAWSAGESVDRFNDLVLPGARVKQTEE